MTRSPRPSRTELADRLSRGFEPVTLLDRLMILLAAANVLMLIAAQAYNEYLDAFQRQLVIWIDLGIVAIFAIEFLERMARAGNKLAYARNHWYDVLGLVPVSHPAFRAFRLVRLVRMYVVRRFPAEGERSWNTALVRGLIDHYRGVLLEEIGDPLVLAWLETIEGPLLRARFAATVGESLDARRVNLHAVVNDAVRHAKGLGHVMSFEAGRELVSSVTDSVLDTVVRTLKSDDLNQVLSESLRNVFTEVKEQIAEKEYKLRGGAILKPAGA